MSGFFRWLRVLVVPAVAFLLAVAAVYPTFTIVQALFGGYAFSAHTWNDSESEKLLAYDDGRYQAIRYANLNLGEDAVTLTFRQSDFAFYSNGDYRSHLDNSLLELFEVEGIERLAHALREHEITHLLVPGYALPAIYNSAFADLIGSPCLAEIVFQAGGYRLFELIDGDCSGSPQALELNLEEFTAAKSGRYWPRVAGKASKLEGANSVNVFDGAAWVSEMEFLSCLSPADLLDQACHLDSSRVSDRIHSLDVEWMVKGKVEIYLYGYDVKGRLIEAFPIWGQIGNGSVKRTRVQFALPVLSRSFRIGFRLAGATNISLLDLSLYRWDRSVPASQRRIIRAVNAGWRAEAPGRSSTRLDWGMMSSGEGFIVATDGRPHRLTTPEMVLNHVPRRISAKLSGVGEATLALQIECSQVGCPVAVDIGQVFLQAAGHSYEFLIPPEDYFEIERVLNGVMRGEFFDSPVQPLQGTGFDRFVRARLIASLAKNKRRYRGSTWYDARMTVHEFNVE